MKKILLILILFIPIISFSQPIDIFQQFNGRYDFTAFGNTLNASPNPCFLQPSSAADLNLGPTETFLSAHLYWSGPWPTANGGDLDVSLNGIPVTASRTFSLTASTGINYFAAYADVSSIIAANGNGTYTFADLNIDLPATGACNGGTDFAGWAIYVIYEDPALLLNQISLFDGLEYISGGNPSLEIILTNIEVGSDDFSKIGFLAWEGDAAIANNETLLINGILIDNPPLNPGDNAFNGTNSYTDSNVLYNMDLDFFDLENIIQPGDTSITINLTSSQDFVMVNNIMTSVNSEIPDATISIDNIGVLCANNNLDIEYTVYNVNSTAPLPTNTPIAFYADNVLIGQSQTTVELPIDGSESGVITLFLPPGSTPTIFTLKAVVDDDGTGVGVVSEINEINNEDELVVDLNLEGLNLGPDIESCIGDTVFLNADVGDPDFVYQWFKDGIILPGATDPILPVTQDGTYYVEAFKGICFVSDEIDVHFNPPPIAVVPDDLLICDELPNDGFGEFDLTLRDAQIQDGQPDTFVTYFLSLSAAQANIFPIATPTAFTNTLQGFQRVFARLEESNFGCFDIVPLDLYVNDSPAITAPITDYFICDNDGDGIEVFDLTSKEDEILNILVNVTLTYHISQADATAGNAPIGTPDVYPSGNAVIWVRAENNAACFTVGSFNLVLGMVPSYTEVPEFFQCDDSVADGVTQFDLNSQNDVITGGNFNLSVSYYATQGDADTASMPLAIPYTNVTNPETIYVRVEDNNTGCYGTFAMDLIVVEAPEIFMPDPLVYCDVDNDGFGVFTLSDADEDVVGGNPSGSLVVSYHRTFADSQNGVNALLSPYNNVDPFNQIVYVRLVDLATGCYNLTTLELIVEESPQISDPSPLVICDTNGDGLAIFNLTLVEPELYAGLDPSDYTTTYYDDPGLAVAIANPTVYPNVTNPQTIYIVVEDIVNGCQSQTTVELIVSLPPAVVSPTPLELCDVNNPGDEMEAFNLNSKIGEITAGNSTLVVTFHATQADADTGDNALVSPYVNTVPQPQTVYIRVRDGNTGCIVSQGYTLDLVVNPVPSPVSPTPLEVCDDDNDGFSSFDLTLKTAEIIGGEPFVSVTYHENPTDAQTGASALISPYFNIVANQQTIYARAEYSPSNPPPSNTGCFRVVELDLIVLSSPVVPVTLPPLLVCDDDGDGVGEFDLTLQEAVIFGGFPPPANYVLTYHLSQGDADTGTNAIGSPQMYTNVSNPQSIFIRVFDTATGCYTVREFELQVVAGPLVSQAEDFTVCDDVGLPNDGFTEFDLTLKDEEIIGIVLGVEVYYYVSQADADADENRIIPSSSYTNISNPQTIFARVFDTNSQCVNTSINFELRVLNNPVVNTPDPIALCDDNNPGDEIEVFDLTQREGQITGNPALDITYFENYQDAFDNVNAISEDISDPIHVGAYPNTSNPQIIYVRVTNLATVYECFEIVELELIVNGFADISASIEDMIVCEINSDGIAIFDLTQKIDEILNGQDPLIHQVSFYETPGDATAGLNPIGATTSYESDGSVSPPGQEIYVGILNTQTGCYIASSEDPVGSGEYSLTFHLQVLEGAEAFPPAGPYVLCDEVAPNDGFTEFDLSVLALEILAGQPYDVTFYETMELAEAGDVATALPTLYTNIVNPQIIYARVTNADTQCYATVSAILKVEQLPTVVLDETYRLCLDADGNPIAEEEGSASPPTIDTGLDPTLYTFAWTLNGSVLLGEVGPSLVALQSGGYTVTITENANGCSQEFSTTVIESSPPLVYGAEVISGAFASSHVIEAMAEGLGTYVFQLDDGPFQDDPIFTGVTAGIHTVTIKDVNGCGSVIVEVSIIDYPRLITPNFDGYHDTWNIIGIGNGDPTAKIYIFDRFGKLLKQLSPLGPGWDGTYNGNPLPSSDYWFRVEYTEDDMQKEFKGHFTLKR
ncbi:gliding motility-associated-like protein [Ulvibacter sp. MAR_2010_11]|uniref:T9SS type B sorting domain-containing protein n=1 Tax=Ulvibacter sp. MAR_2010_11 TaxID=1250229 RepID=UPI000C2C0637|nr:T9SS type B sorting domain-containing protein [Ulvibacter sp. MAR_2010_11]PKA83557.1 gliding motility-associated-like protein [Ulvibacter sp. MAR_2010_11]